jgi:hypothetical protein
MSVNSVPDNLVITPVMENEGWRLFGPKPTDEQLQLADVVIEGGDMHRRSGRWPTIAEASEHLDARFAAREARYEAALLPNPEPHKS